MTYFELAGVVFALQFGLTCFCLWLLHVPSRLGAWIIARTSMNTRTVLILSMLVVVVAMAATGMWLFDKGSEP